MKNVYKRLVNMFQHEGKTDTHYTHTVYMKVLYRKAYTKTHDGTHDGTHWNTLEHSGTYIETPKTTHPTF